MKETVLLLLAQRKDQIRARVAREVGPSWPVSNRGRAREARRVLEELSMIEHQVRGIQ